MRIVFLTHNYPRFPGDVAGAFLAVLAGALLARGHEVRVIAPSDQGRGGEALMDGIPVRRVRYATPSGETLAYRGTMADAARTPLGLWRFLGLLRAFHRAAREEAARGADVIHAHWWVPAGLAAPWELPLVITVHGTDARLLTRSAVGRWLSRPVFRRARVVTAVSGAAAARITQATGRIIGPGQVQPMPVDPAHLTGWSSGGGGAVTVTRLTAQKRVDLVIRAVAILREQRYPLALTIAGDGPEKAALEQLVAALGLGGEVRFAGAVSANQAAALLRTADLALYPAREEGFGLAAAEALMAGIPVVACRDGGGLLDVVPSTGAGRIADADPVAIATQIRAIAGDPAARGEARAAGLAWRERLTPQRVAEICEGWYREAIGAP